MNEYQVKSKVIHSIGYDDSQLSLQVKFLSGYVYAYEQVPESVYYALIASESIGAFFNKHIKGKYNERKIK